MEFVGRVQKLSMDFRNAGGTLDEESIVAKIVGGLTPEYHTFMTTWANSSLNQTIAELLPRLQSEELLIAGFNRKDNTALVSEGFQQ